MSAERKRAINEHYQRFRLKYSRIHGARMALLRRAATARSAAMTAEREGSLHFAASLRGKFHAYTEAAQLLEQLEFDRKLSRRDRRAA